MTRTLTLALILLMGLTACRSTRPAATPDEEPVAARENLHSTLWVQTSVEYAAAARQAYVLATVMLERALEDSSWTAALAQSEMEDYRTLPPAVVLDVDETVLDNTPYQARLVLEGETYDSESWQDWVREEGADAIPGALAFTQYAAAQGVEVFYLTNRDAEVEPATRRNLRALGFPLDAGQDVILTQGERPGWEGKEPRRRFVADDYRILLLVGDNYGDFMAGVDTTVEARRTMAAEHAAYWGTRWIVLPNPQYGSWEESLYNFDYSLPAAERLRLKYRTLDPAR